MLIRVILGAKLQGSEVLGSGFQRFRPRLVCLRKAQAPIMSSGARRRLDNGFWLPASFLCQSTLHLICFCCYLNLESLNVEPLNQKTDS